MTKFPLLCGLLATLALLAGCQAPPLPASTDVLSQKIPMEGRVPVTVLVKYAFSINAFEKAAEDKFPNLDIVQVGNFTRDRGIIEFEQRMKHGDLTDIIMQWPLRVGEEYWEERLLDLSSLPCTSRYSTAMLNSIAHQGKLYYLPGPAQVRGIVYNKTLFAEKGWKLPTNHDEFVALCKTIEASGMRSLQLGFYNAEVLDTAFVGFGYGSSFSTPAAAQWLADYNKGKGRFEEQFSSALSTFQSMIDAGIWKAKDLDINYAAREQMFFTRQCAMIEDSALVARMGNTLTGTTDEFAIMPFFNPGTPSDWARLYMVCYIGLNKKLADPGNKEKYNLVLALMDYISTPEGQSALAADTGAMYSSVKNVPPPNIPEIAALRTTLAQGRYAIFPELTNAQNALRAGLAGMVAGATTSKDVARMVDKQNQSPVVAFKARELGTATADFTILETGNFFTDVMRTKTGADVALFLDNGKDGRFNGKGISGRLYAGPQSANDVLRVFPDLKHGEAGILQLATMTGENLLKTLEHAIVMGNDQRGWFYYFSGLRMEFSPTAQPGTRIRSITDAEGKPIDPDRMYTIAAMDHTLPPEHILSLKDTGTSIIELVTQAIQGKDTIAPANDGRFSIVK